MLAWHRRGYLHRDIKPDNLRVTAGGDVVIIDANIAKRIDKCWVDERDGFKGDEYASGTKGFMDPLVRDGIRDWAPNTEAWSVGETLKKVRRAEHRVAVVVVVVSAWRVTQRVCTAAAFP